MNEQYLPIRESLGYRNLKVALYKVFLLDLDSLPIQEGGNYENFSLLLPYKEYAVTLVLSGTGKNIQFEYGEGGELSIILSNPNDQFWGESELHEVVSDMEIRKRIRYIFGRDVKKIEYALTALKDFLDSNEAEVLLKH